MLDTNYRVGTAAACSKLQGTYTSPATEFDQLPFRIKSQTRISNRRDIPPEQMQQRRTDNPTLTPSYHPTTLYI